MHIPACGDHQQTETQTQQGGSLVRTVQEAKGAVTGGGEDDTSFASRIIDFGSLSWTAADQMRSQVAMRVVHQKGRTSFVPLGATQGRTASVSNPAPFRKLQATA